MVNNTICTDNYRCHDWEYQHDMYCYMLTGKKKTWWNIRDNMRKIRFNHIVYMKEVYMIWNKVYDNHLCIYIYIYPIL